tara:strand:- start:183 stop:548 length:366 start_codon:yes stop_codon:yes gene_type:complete
MPPKPKVEAKSPDDVAGQNDVLAKQRQMYPLIALALQTDSTGVATFGLGELNSPPSNIKGVCQDWHNLSHHGKDEAKFNEFEIDRRGQIFSIQRIPDTTQRNSPRCHVGSLWFQSWECLVP